MTASPKMKVPTDPATADSTYTARKMSPPSTCRQQPSHTTSTVVPNKEVNVHQVHHSYRDPDRSRACRKVAPHALGAARIAQQQPRR